MPAEQVHLVVRKPLSDIEQEIRRRYGVRSNLADVAIEQDALVFTFEGAPHVAAPPKLSNPDSSGVSSKYPSRKRRKQRVRNRMKTRGWDVVAKFVNSRGLSCTIYRPFYAVLSTQKLKRREAYSTVRDILVANGNNPKPSSVEYFLNNTLEYIGRRSESSPLPLNESPAKTGAASRQDKP